MCGRFTLTAAPEALAAAFQVEVPLDLAPRYNIAPSQPILVVTADSSQRRLMIMRWGLVPAWAAAGRAAAGLINARCETVHEKPAFRNALRYRRCLVPASGFYEWQPTADGKQPFYFAPRDGNPIAFAAIYEAAHADRPATVALLTTAANALLAPIHDRMPLILPAEAYQAWLDTTQGHAEALIAGCQPWPAATFSATPVGRFVNRVTNDGPQLIAPADQWQAQSLDGLF